MARFIGSLSEGSLLRRTLLCVGTFALGSAAFVALVSFVLVTVAKAVLPSPASAEAPAAKEDVEAAAEEPGGLTGKLPTLKQPRTPKRAPRAAQPAEGSENTGE